MQVNKENTRNFINVFGFGTLISLISLLITWMVMPITENIPVLIFYMLGVLVSASHRGLKAGITTAVLTALGTAYFFPPPPGSTYIQSFPYFSRLIFFLASGIVTCIIVDRLVNTEEVIKYKRLEKQYLKTIEELKEESIRQKREIKSRDEFLSIASHELKTPLSSMLLQIQAALNNIRNVSLANFSVAKLMKMLESTEAQSFRLSRMISDLLNVSLITTGRLELEKTEVDLVKLTREVLARFSERAKRDGYKIKIEARDKVEGIWDKLRMEQAVANLVSNAIKYGGGKPIDIKVERSGSTAKVSVTDHGIGIPQEQRERIFERFERGVSKADYKGLGVGLYITSQIVKTHQGSIKLSSKPGNGSTFTIELPITKKPGKK